MNSQLVNLALGIVEQRPAPDQSIPYFNSDTGEVTGYSWGWTTPDGLMTIDVRIQPGQRDKIGNRITLHVKRENVSIRTKNHSTDIGNGDSYQLSFSVARSKPLAPIEGLVDLLRSTIEVPLNI